ncbi:MAG: hemerythrin domain-containing protein [Candidatus Omnitrophica bacterium]|nr:hemerythrin domain-containing protein [Candidatus Omnitrophota bacterium]
MKNVTSFFDGEEKEMLRQVEGLHKTLTYLKYEGKAIRGKNLKAAQTSLQALVKNLQRHRALQEKIIFPFLLIHIPKHEAVIRFLRSDHQDIKRNKKRLGLLLGKLSKRPAEVNGELHDLGVYLICLLRHHLELEKENIHRAIKKELRKDEKREVGEKIAKWLKSHKGPEY